MKSTDTTPLVGESDPEGSDHKRKSLWSDTTRRQKLVLIYLISAKVSLYLIATVPTSFMTTVILDKGGVEIEASILLQIPRLAVAITSLIFGKYQVHLNIKNLHLLGTSCFAVCQICFGLLSFASNVDVLVAVGVTIRLLQGVGQGAFAVSILTILCQEFPDLVTVVFGFIESIGAAGLVCGPFVGSLLYDISGNFLLAFVLSGAIMLPLTVVGYCVLGNYIAAERGHSRFRIRDVLRKPLSAFVAATVAVIFGGFGLISVLGSEYMTLRGLTIEEVGLALSTSTLSYSIGSAVAGYLTRYGRSARRISLVIGVIGTLLHPLIFSSDQTTAGIFIGMVMSGLFPALVVVTSFAELLNLASDEDPQLKSDISFQSALSGIWVLFVGIGNFAIPLIGSSLYSILSYRLVTITCTASGVGLAAIVSLIMLIFLK